MSYSNLTLAAWNGDELIWGGAHNMSIQSL